MVLKDKINKETMINEYHHYAEDIIKFCIDRKRRKVALDREMHIEMEHELYDDGSDYSDIFGGNIVIEDDDVIDIEWEAHPNIERNRMLGIGAGRELTDKNTVNELTLILRDWIEEIDYGILE